MTSGLGPVGATIVRTPGADAVARPIVTAAAAVGALGGAAWLAYRALGGHDDAQAARGAGNIGATLPTARPSQPDARVELVKRAPRAATSASDPAAFDALLRTAGPGWTAADGTISVPLGDGRTLWLFGDTLVRLPELDGALDFVRNSAVVQEADGRTVRTLVSGASTNVDSFLAPTQEGQWYWPGHGIAEGDEVVVFMTRLRETDGSARGWNFESVGTDLVRLDRGDLSLVGRAPMPQVPGVDWGTAVLEHGEHTLVFGFRGDPDDPLVREAVVARAPKGQVAGGELEYWNGRRWTRDASKVAAIADGVSPSYSVVRAPGGTLAMVSQELFFGTKLQVRTAAQPDGRWSAWRTIDPGPRVPGRDISYNGQVHPSFTDDGRVLASWNLNRRDGHIPTESQLEDYRPVFRSIDADRLRPTPGNS